MHLCNIEIREFNIARWREGRRGGRMKRRTLHQGSLLCIFTICFLLNTGQCWSCIAGCSACPQAQELLELLHICSAQSKAFASDHVQYSAIQCHTVQYSTVQCDTVQYSTVQYSAIQYSTVQCDTVPYSGVQCGVEHFSAVISG